MFILFGILIIVASIVLGLIVLVQNPKGGGLSGTLGGFSTQFIGVKQTTDVMEKGTWLFAAIVGVLCLVSPAFIPKEGTSKGGELINNMSTSPAKKSSVPANTAPMSTPSANPGDTNKK